MEIICETNLINTSLNLPSIVGLFECRPPASQPCPPHNEFPGEKRPANVRIPSFCKTNFESLAVIVDE